MTRLNHKLEDLSVLLSAHNAEISKKTLEPCLKYVA